MDRRKIHMWCSLDRDEGSDQHSSVLAVRRDFVTGIKVYRLLSKMDLVSSEQLTSVLASE